MSTCVYVVTLFGTHIVHDATSWDYMLPFKCISRVDKNSASYGQDASLQRRFRSIREEQATPLPLKQPGTERVYQREDDTDKY